MLSRYVLVLGMITVARENIGSNNCSLKSVTRLFWILIGTYWDFFCVFCCFCRAIQNTYPERMNYLIGNRDPRFKSSQIIFLIFWLMSYIKNFQNDKSRILTANFWWLLLKILWWKYWQISQYRQKLKGKISVVFGFWLFQRKVYDHVTRDTELIVSSVWFLHNKKVAYDWIKRHIRKHFKTYD